MMSEGERMEKQDSLQPIVLERQKFDLDDIREMHTLYIENYPIVYILHQDKETKSRPKAYIGQTVHVHNRMRDHLKNQARKDLTDALFIGHQTFNQSATFNIETNLINYFIADNQFSLQNVSQTANLSMHNYYQKSFYDDDYLRTSGNPYGVRVWPRRQLITLKIEISINYRPLKPCLNHSEL